MRRTEKKQRKKIKIFSIFLVLLLFCIIIYTLGDWYKESKIKTKKQSQNIQKVQQINDNKEKEESQKLLELVPKEQDGYTVIAQLQIPKIGVNTNVLKEYSVEALEICVTRFWGANPNEIGNCCIAGHNYNKTNMFGKLKQLEIGDTIILTDNKNGINSYKIYDIYKVEPENTTPLSQNTNGQKELTLITCTNYSKQRIIVKARQII